MTHGILLVGPVGSGKSSFIKSLTTEHVEILRGVKPCTLNRSHVELHLAITTSILANPSAKATSECKAYTVEQELAGVPMKFAIIDTPGFGNSPQSDLDTVRKIAQYLDRMRPKFKICGVIYFHRITDRRFAGDAQTSLAISKDICGEGFLPRVAVMTTMWDTIDKNKYKMFERLNEQLERLDGGHLRLSGAGPPIFKRLRDDEESSRDVLKHFASLVGTVEEAPELLLAEEWRRMGRTGTQRVYKTAAGMKIMGKISAERQCTIF
ncbi:hypothetical protein B0T25DRAFT_605252 [Lasiosphaeria hispida]|uniref:Septin-type G domain-containing protein n=1 Tax=Lasiosphaeria hispida TaxID=260671 RepID=A0AAJ0HN23_9PEZI|nr:hypothetical protein B0T25DRAFT_605252 [Lasiosphaeria hispida]